MSWNCREGLNAAGKREVERLRRFFSKWHSPHANVCELTSSPVPGVQRSQKTLRASVTPPPVIICPYVYEHEAAEIRIKFGLDRAWGRKMESFLWQDTGRIGPERAFQYCWDQFPDRDVVILHSDMKPMPGDISNRWYDALLHYRDQLPRVGMLACNLYYPRSGPQEPWRVQCAGGIIRDGNIGHINGPLQEEGRRTERGVPAALLRIVREVDWVTFGGVLIRREVIRACGGIDDRYQWAYVMDVDYCLEARRRGFHLIQVPVSLQHEESRTTRSLCETDLEFRDYIARNLDLFYEKWRLPTAA